MSWKLFSTERQGGWFTRKLECYYQGMTQHGTGTWFLEDRIVIGEARGPFNYEGILSLRVGMMSLPVCHDDEPWAIALALFGDSLFTPKAEEEHKRLLHELADLNLSGVAYSLADHNAKAVFEHQIKRIYEGTGVSVGIVETMDEALTAARNALEG